MARKDPRPEVNRRKFLAGVAVAGAATAVTPPVANGATPATSPNAEPPRRGGKASVARDRSAIPRAPRALSRLRNVGSSGQNAAAASRTGRGPRPSAALFFVLFFGLLCIVVHCYWRALECRAGSHEAARRKPKFALGAQRPHY